MTVMKRGYLLFWVLGLVLNSVFCVNSAAAVSLGSVTLTRVAARILTPNGDGLNDKARFLLDNPEQIPVSGSIFDLSGARVRDLENGVDQLLWDGKDSSGQKVAGGIYVYQIEFEGKHATGTVVVAR
jgi:hypothetical protein